METTHTFESKRDAQKRKNVGSFSWDAAITDHSNPNSLLEIVANGPILYNASGPAEWSKVVTYRVAPATVHASARIDEIKDKLLPALRPHWDRDKWVDGVLVACSDLNRDELRDRAEWTKLKAEIAILESVK